MRGLRLTGVWALSRRFSARAMIVAAAAACAAAACPFVLHAQINILSNRYNGGRNASNLAESTLTAANVNVNRFGKLYSYPVDGAVLAQPLYMSGVVIAGATHNVLYVATMNDKVYAFDADSAAPAPLWVADFTSPPAVTAVPITDIAPPNLNIIGNVGIQSTPVIDPASGTMYVIAKTKESGTYVQRIHAIDVTSGLERPGSPVAITAAVPGTALDSTMGPGGRVVPFDPKMQAQRAGLGLVNGVIVAAWGSHEDLPPYHGWIMAFDAATLAKVGVFAVTPDAYGAGVWQGGRAPTIDANGYVYYATGNGNWDGTRNFGDSLLKFRADVNGLTLVDFFTPGNEAQLNIDDDDLSGSGFTLLPGTSLLLGGGKEGVLYLLDSNRLGGKVVNDTQVVQKLTARGGHVMGGPVFWMSPFSGPLVYNWSEDDVLKAFRLSNGTLITPPFAQGQTVSPGHPGGSLAISSNGSTSGTGIVWASMPTSQDGLHGLVAGMLRAFNAETLQEIWTSEQNPARDRVGTLMKFVPPVIANGRVYLPSYDNRVNVYGLLPSDFGVASGPGGQTIAPGASATFAVSVSGVGGFGDVVNLSAAGLPAGATATFSPSFVAGPGTSTMTVTAAPDAPTSSSWVTVMGTRGDRVRSAPPVVVNINSSAAGLGPIGIDFTGTAPVPMSASEVAGVVPMSNWNSAPGGASTGPLLLVDGSGTATGATVTWTSNAGWMLPTVDQPGDRRMMKGYLDSTNTSTTTIAISRLVPRTYDIYVYVDGDNRTYDRAGNYTLTGPGLTPVTVQAIDPASTNFSGTFVQAVNSNGNYLKFTVTGGDFFLSATPQAAAGTRRAPVNAVEIVPVVPQAPPMPGTISVNFVGSSSIAMGPSEVAGVVGAANWNNATGAARSEPQVLVDEKGSATTASLVWTANGVWTLPITDQPGNRRLMKGYLDTSSTSVTTVSVSGLAAREYDVYVYADGDNRTYARTGAYTVSGPGITTTTVNLIDPAGTNFTGALIPGDNSAGNYVRFSISGTGFTITAMPLSGGNATLRAPINGLQIVPRQAQH